MLRIEYLFTIAVLLTVANILPISSSQAQNSYWSQVQEHEHPDFVQSAKREIANSFSLYRVDIKAFKNQLKARSGADRLRMNLPWRGALKTFSLTERSILGKELADKYPEISTYKGRSLDGKI